MGDPTASRQAREREFYDREYVAEGRSPDRFYVISGPAWDRFRELLGELGPGDRVLEYGCGAGGVAFELASRGADVIGIDISPVAVERATKRAEAEGLSERLSFQVMDAERLGFEDGSFDLVCGGAILHHLDLERACGEVSRTLRPGGRAVFLEPLGHNPLIRAYRRRTPQHRTPDEHPLRISDLDAAGRHFGRVQTSFFNLLTLAAVPLRGRRSFDSWVRRLTRADQRLFVRLPGLRKHAWMVVIELADPR